MITIFLLEGVTGLVMYDLLSKVLNLSRVDVSNLDITYEDYGQAVKDKEGNLLVKVILLHKVGNEEQDFQDSIYYRYREVTYEMRYKITSNDYAVEETKSIVEEIVKLARTNKTDYLVCNSNVSHFDSYIDSAVKQSPTAVTINFTPVI